MSCYSHKSSHLIFLINAETVFSFSSLGIFLNYQTQQSDVPCRIFSKGYPLFCPIWYESLLLSFFFFFFLKYLDFLSYPCNKANHSNAWGLVHTRGVYCNPRQIWVCILELSMTFFFLTRRNKSVISSSRYLILVRIVKTYFKKSCLMTKKKEWISIHLFEIGIERNNFIRKIIRYFLNPNFVTLKIQKVSHRKKKHKLYETVHSCKHIFKAHVKRIISSSNKFCSKEMVFAEEHLKKCFLWHLLLKWIDPLIESLPAAKNSSV